MRKRLFLALGLLVVFGVASWANPPGVAVIRTANSGAAFADPADPPQPSDTQKAVQEILKRLDSIEKKLDKIMEEGSDPPEKPEAADTTNSIKILEKGLTICLECHSPKTAPKNGDRFVMFGGPKGNELREDFRRSELQTIENKVRDGTMPKKTASRKLTTDEKAAIIAEVSAKRAELEKLSNPN